MALVNDLKKDSLYQFRRQSADKCNRCSAKKHVHVSAVLKRTSKCVLGVSGRIVGKFSVQSLDRMAITIVHFPTEVRSYRHNRGSLPGLEILRRQPQTLRRRAVCSTRRNSNLFQIDDADLKTKRNGRVRSVKEGRRLLE